MQTAEHLETTDLLDSASLGRYKRSELVDDTQGLTYAEFRKGLRPRFGVVWLHIGAGYAALLLVSMAAAWGMRFVSAWLVAPVAAALFGYIQAYLQLFFHEAAHFNIAPDRAWNDRLANLFIGLLAGQDIKSYRRIHFGHHRHLGETVDPERTYFDPLNARFLVEALLVMKTLRVLRLRRELLRAQPASADSADSATSSDTSRIQMVLGLFLHAALLAALFTLRLAPVALAWMAGMVFFFPFFTAVRQVLEHRSETADDAVDYSQTPHGEVTRMFSSGPVGSTMGGAGFDRHLLHHWDPQVSYTRLPELERFLSHTRAAPAVSVKESYFGAFRRLFRAGARRGSP